MNVVHIPDANHNSRNKQNNGEQEENLYL